MSGAIEFAKNWIMQNLLEGTAEMCQQFITLFGTMIENVFNTVTTFNNSYMKGVDTFTSAFALAFIAFITVKSYMDTYVFETAGDPESDPLDLFVRAAQATVVASCSNTIYNILDGFSSAFVKDLQSVHITNGAEIENTGVADTLLTILSIPKNFESVPSVIMLIAVAMVIALVVFFVIAGKRGAELLFMKMLFPIFACDLVTTNRERFNGFFTSFLVVWLAYGIQLISFKLFCITLLKYTTCNMTQFPIIFASNIGFAWMMFSAPKWIEKFTYTSGISNSVTGALRTLPFLLRVKH